jgi:hypothetical protein
VQVLVMLRLLSAALAALTLGSTAQASVIDLTTMTRNVSAVLSGSSLVLTPSVGFRMGTAFIASPFAVQAGTTFSASFQFAITDPVLGGADGLAFVVHNDTAGAAAVGGAGGGLGYLGLAPSVAVEFDNYQNLGVDPNGAHIGINLDGSSVSAVTAPAGVSLDTLPQGFAWIDYDGTMLDVYFSTTNTQPGGPLLSLPFDIATLGAQAYFGLTAATGGAAAEHRIDAFTLDVSSPSPVPLPASLPALVLGVGALWALGRRRRAALIR